MTTRLPDDHGAFFALSVADYNAAVGWYTRHLGFRIEAEAENDIRKGALLSKPGLLLEIAQFHGARPRSNSGETVESHKVHGIFKIGFLVPDIDTRFKEAEESGLDITFSIVPAAAGFRTFGVSDPEGNQIQFFGK
ncbi:MAG: hypothetical protein DPW18_11900 [Chloroflexi bacterium]|nr:hypothetical protein [Chloroflexota bacterium]MDL1942515.1 VOC family protein [Chloroflexi bacterium CFX2]